MMATLIAAVSLAALAQVYVSYCRSVLASARKVELSARVAALAAIEGESVAAGDFDRVLQLVRLCPEHDADRTAVRAIGTYYRLLQFLSRVIGAFHPGVTIWTEHESQGCSHFAAVVLDRCISSSRSLFTQQAGDHL
jgi:hypothetical protein